MDTQSNKHTITLLIWIGRDVHKLIPLSEGLLLVYSEHVQLKALQLSQNSSHPPLDRTLGRSVFVKQLNATGYPPKNPWVKGNTFPKPAPRGFLFDPWPYQCEQMYLAACSSFAMIAGEWHIHPVFISACSLVETTTGRIVFCGSDRASLVVAIFV